MKTYLPIKNKKVRKLSDKQLFFIWKVLNDLEHIHHNQLESGAKDYGYYAKSVRARQLIQQQRKYNKQ